MFEAYSVKTMTYATNDAIEFENVRVSDPRIDYDSPYTISIKTPGKYLIKFNGVGASGTNATPFSIQLYNNNVAIPEAASTITSTLAGEEQTLMFETIININRSCCAIDNTARLKILATSTASGTMSLANITILKLR